MERGGKNKWNSYGGIDFEFIGNNYLMYKF